MNPRLVYVVDDEEAIRRSLHLMLRVLGYEARQFESGAAFLARLPGLARGFDHPKVKVVIGDGFEFLRGHEDEFDVIITDSSDPVGTRTARPSKAFA